MKNVFASTLVLLLYFTAGRTQTLEDSVASIQAEIEQIRGAKFKHQVKVKYQSVADFGKYLEKQIDRQLPQDLLKNYGKVIKKLGLYRGPEIKDFKAMIKMVMQSQAAAYYDPSTATFYVVMQNLPEQTMKAIYSHELYHGFQDQYHDLDRFVLEKAHGDVNDDEMLARQAVVEGEATYVMSLWTMKTMFGSIPDRSLLGPSIKMQAEMDVGQLLTMLKSGAVPQAESGGMQKAIEDMDKIPAFMIETMVGSYLKGMAFVYEIQEHGWGKVDALYQNPPISSEQIIHPKKWFENELPIKIRLGSFDSNKLFENWKLLESNTIGELQWRIIFSEHDLVEAGKAAAAGWNGDTFAILENKRTDKLMLLLYSSWDSETDAMEFMEAYQKLLERKYAGKTEPVHVDKINSDVLIIEGGRGNQLNAHLDFLKKSKKVQARK